MRLGTKRILNTSQKSKKRAGLLVFICLIFVSFAIFSGYVFYVLRPGVISMAKAKAKEIGVLTINKVVSEKLRKESIEISDLVAFEYAENGKISALNSNVSMVSRLKSDLAIEVTNAIKDISKSEVGITLGTLSGVDILYGIGPVIPIEIAPYGYAATDIKTKFHEEGINQTAFEIEAQISAEIFVLMPSIKSSETIKTNIPIASSVIVGDVPGSYTNVDRDGLEYEDDVLQLAE